MKRDEVARKAANPLTKRYGRFGQIDWTNVVNLEMASF